MNRISDNSTRLTRRSWAALVAVTPLVAQTVSTPPSVVPAPAASDKAVAEMRKVSDRLAQTEVPMAIEPAFSFRA